MLVTVVLVIERVEVVVEGGEKGGRGADGVTYLDCEECVCLESGQVRQADAPQQAKRCR
jgi:hypothetical protein